MPIIIFDFNRTLYDPEKDELVPEVGRVLTELQKRGFAMFVVSRAETSDASAVIRELGLGEYFKGATSVGEKSIEHFQKLLQENNANPGQSFVIGDRVEDEIALGNQLGMQTVWLRRGVFANRLPRRPEEYPKYTIHSLSELLPLVGWSR